FRNLRLRELPPTSPPLEPKLVADLDQGFTSIYNGLDLTGWKHGPALDGHWVPKDWILDYDGNGDMLWSEAEYGDFQMIADWRWTAKPVDNEVPDILPSGEQALDADGKPRKVKIKDAGDSGIYLRGNDKSQVNIWCWPIGSGEVYGYRTDKSMSAAVRAGV